jgi:hypothetical protein
MGKMRGSRFIVGEDNPQNSELNFIYVAINRQISQFRTMKFDSLIAKLPPTGLFRTGDILAGEKSPADVRRQLNRWVKSGRIVQIRRGVYQLQKPYRALTPHPFLVANVLCRASYISLQSALSYYGMIPEHVPVVTSITGRRPEELDTAVGRFIFRHVQSSYFCGFVEKEITSDQSVRIATPEKALADLLYLTPDSDRPDYLVELRLERPENFDISALMKLTMCLRSPKLKRAIAQLNQLWKEEASHETIID